MKFYTNTEVEFTEIEYLGTQVTLLNRGERLDTDVNSYFIDATNWNKVLTTEPKKFTVNVLLSGEDTFQRFLSVIEYSSKKKLYYYQDNYIYVVNFKGFELNLTAGGYRVYQMKAEFFGEAL